MEIEMMNEKEVITSRQNPAVKRVCALCDKKEREKTSLFRFDGIKLFCEAVANRVQIEGVYIKESAAKTVESRISSELCEIGADKIRYVCDSVFDKMSEERAPEGIITVAKYIDKFNKIVTIEKADMPSANERVLLLEAIRDPGNLGTIIRSAAALGVKRVVISSDCADLYNSKTVRASMGGVFHIFVDSVPAELMPDYIERLRENGRRVFAAALRDNADVLGEFDLLPDDCFVIGNEGHGLSAAVIDACNGSVIIPMEEGSESLNAAGASLILMWEMYRSNRN
ncbi:MAG: RNA methyltransferase [Ruminococcaceae bacterium]|nr:RNA methyltransferase [Oscillospiraceae bacterium]